MRTAIVIPAYNEESSIFAVVKEVLQHPVDVIVIDDGSSDNTAALAEEAGAIVVSEQQNAGYDQAINLGFSKAAELGYDSVITMDADGQHPVSVIPEFLHLLTQVECVVGFRPKMQRWSETLFSIISRVLWRVRDPLCGMKGYRTSIWLSHRSFDTYGSCGTELMLKAIRSGVSVKECAVDVLPREGESRFGMGFSANLRIVRALVLGLLGAFRKV